MYQLDHIRVYIQYDPAVACVYDLVYIYSVNTYMTTCKQQLVNDILYILELRLRVSQARYPTSGRLQHMDQMGYLIGIITECALADNMVERHLYRILKELKRTG